MSHACPPVRARSSSCESSRDRHPNADIEQHQRRVLFSRALNPASVREVDGHPFFFPHMPPIDPKPDATVLSPTPVAASHPGATNLTKVVPQ